MNYWDLKHKIDDFYSETVNCVARAYYFLKSIFAGNVLYKNSELKNIHSGKRAFYLGNAPSINSQNLIPLKDEITFAVNRGFLHPDYSKIKPKYHIIIDGKFITGEWEFNFLEQAKKLNPNVTFFLNAKWSSNKKLQQYLEDNEFEVYWIDMRLIFTNYYKYRNIDLTKITYGGGVHGAAITVMIYMGIKDIYLTGLDGNGLCYELINQESHFYGENKENKFKSIRDKYMDLYAMAINLKCLCYYSEYCKKNGVAVINCTNGGIMDMFERKTLKDILSKKI